MTEQTGHAVALGEADVADYLESHPDFFDRHPSLLEGLNIPHSAGAAVSLVERQVRMLREKNSELERKLQHLARAARTNERLLERLQVLILGLVGSEGFDQAVAILSETVREDFHADFVVLKLLGAPERPETVAPGTPQRETVERLLAKRQPICGYLDAGHKRVLFGASGDDVASAVVIPLCERPDSDCLGLLAIGSVDPKRFHPEMGTVFVAHLGAVTARVLRGHLEA